MAIANLKKEIASAPQSNSFIIEESCTETTVENFIPHVDRQNFVEIDYENLDNQVFLNPQSFNQDVGKNNVIQLTLPSNGQSLTTDKIKNILSNDANSNIEIMFKTNEGNYVTLTDDVLQNLQKDGLQYQVIDEEGRMGELQELQLIGKENVVDLSNITEGVISKEQNCLINPNNFFNNPQQILGNEPLDMTIDNPKVLGGSTINDLDPKDIEIISFNTVDIKPTFLTQNTSDSERSFVDDYLNMRDQNEMSFTSSIEKEDCKIDIEVATDNIILLSNDSIKSNGSSSKKFSPDIFFADNLESIKPLNGPESKKICPNDTE